MKASARRQHQPDLFGQPATVLALRLSDPVFDYEPIHVQSSTFLAGLSQRIHRWFRLTPSFGPDLVQEIVEVLGLPKGAHIHDPFSGAGTTAIEASLEGFRSSCVEINPFLHFVNHVCLTWSLDAGVAASLLKKIEFKARGYKASTTLEAIEAIGVTIPPIHNVYRWWRPDVLHATLCIKAAILEVEDRTYRDFFRLALAGVLVPDLTNVTLGRLQLHFIDRTAHKIDAWGLFEKHASMMIEDLSLLNATGAESETMIQHGDSTNADTYKNLDRIDAVITSPPYPNRYSYVWNTRPHLYMLDFLKDAKAATEIDKRTIGGTWGTATSELMKGEFVPRNDCVLEALDGVHQRIRVKDNLMANYVVHYFNRLSLHLEALAGSLNEACHLAYVVGNSSIKDEYISTDVILGKIIEGTVPGMKVPRIHRFRKRHSGENLFESIVYANRAR